nr:ribonuclease H-like domain-containing protein [Tanacetum cinerariifolium]
MTGSNIDDLLVKLLGRLGVSNKHHVPIVDNTSNITSSTNSNTTPNVYYASPSPIPVYFHTTQHSSPSTIVGLPPGFGPIRVYVSNNRFSGTHDCPGTGDHSALCLYCRMGHLYPVTAPSSIPHAFLVSQHTWHQRLGHPGGDVLRRLVSSNFISYNKEKPPVLCNMCQLGKYLRPLFVSSSTVIRSCFDVIHSDVWTSPILSLSVQLVCLHKHDPREPYFLALKWILRYVCGTLDYGLRLFSSSTTDLVAYSDADWAGCPTT